VLARVRVILHRPQSAENLGAAARVMKNFGLRDLAVVAPPSWSGPPRGGGPGLAREDVLGRAARTARHAADVLARLSVHESLRAALGPAAWACGTTSRTVEGRPRLSPRELARELWRRSAGGVVAVVFGEERRGLSDAELTLCQAVCSIPTHPDYDSMNLAQAVAVVSYEVALAAGAAAAPPAPAPGGEPALHATVEALWERARAVLARAGYLNPQNPEHILADLRRLLARADPTQREIELVVAALRAIERQLRMASAEE
jgi:tRNA/rRNA methyltransferase